MRNPVLDAVLSELRMAGVRDNFAAGSKHNQIQWEGRDGQPRNLFEPPLPKAGWWNPGATGTHA